MTDQAIDLAQGQPTGRPTRHTARHTAIIGILAVAAVLLLASVVTKPETAHADCTCGCPPDQCFDGSTFKVCDCGSGGEATPAPAATQVIEPPPPPPPPGSTPTGNAPSVPVPTQGPRPTATPVIRGGQYAWSCECGGTAPLLCSRCAQFLRYVVPSEGSWLVTYRCVDNCGGTPTPQPTLGPWPTPVPDWPCDEPPIIADGIIRQPCSKWPGWYIDVVVIIPPAAALVNPWPRSLCGLETYFWYLGASDVEQFSAGKALECSGIDYGRAYHQSTYNCGGTVGQVAEGTRVNYQIGAAWRQWRWGTPAIFGQYPLNEAVWTIPDREWNGGMKVFGVGKGERLGYTFATSSWVPHPDMSPGQEDYCEEHDCVSGMGLGPKWNPYCQEHDCRCEERVIDPLGESAYMVTLTTFWWPEYTFRYDEYYCAASEWSACWGPYPPPGYPVGQVSRGCDANGDGQNDPGYYEVQQCSEWRWRNVTSPLNCTTVNPRTGWCMYDLRELGANPLVASNKVITAGAFPDGNRCGQGVDCCPWYDNWPYYVPVPVIELQPGGVGWEGRTPPR